jgi:hypothetical protein
MSQKEEIAALRAAIRTAISELKFGSPAKARRVLEEAERP